jgi:PAS domain S-box-containing protein
MKKLYFINFIILFCIPLGIYSHDYNDSVISLESSLKQLNDSSKIKVLNDLSWYFRTLNPEKSIELATRGLEIAKEINDLKNTATFYNILGVTNSIVGNYTIALENHFRGLSIREKNNDSAGIAASLNNIGLVYEKLEDYNNALNYYKKSYAIKKKLKDNHAIMVSLNNIGYVLRRLGFIDESLKYYLSALKLNLEFHDNVGLSLTYSNLGLLYREKKLFTNALDYSFRSLKLREELNDNSGIALQYYIIGTIYSEQNQHNLALSYFNKSLVVARKYKYRPVIQDNYIAISLVYEKMKNFKLAYEFHKKFHALRDSLLSEEKTGRIIELQERYNSKQKEIKIQKLELEKFNQFRNYSFIIAVLILIFIIVMFIRYRISRKLLKSLKESEIFNSELINNLPSYLLIFDKDKIIYSNKLVQEVFGYDQSEFEKLNYLEIVADEYKELVKKNRNDRYQGKEIPPYEIAGITRSGEKRNLIVRATTIPYRNINAILTLLNDITDLKKYEKELVFAKERAEYSDKLKSEFLAQISHEIRTPLNVILSWTSMLENDLKDKLNPDIKDVFEIIREQGKRTIRTIELILNMSEIQLGSYEPIFRKIDLENEIIIKLIADTKLEATKKGLNFSYKKSTDNSIALIDEYSVTQSIKNIFENAVKFTKEGSIEVLMFRNSNHELSIAIKDTGIGISEEYIPDLFKPFRQEQQGYTRIFEGNGLGLALTKKFLELNNATIKVESKKNIGSTFTVTFLNS